MPFTLTHTLAVLPFAHRRSALPITALLIGAMVPDWSLFVPFGPHYNTTHTVLGLFSACMPLGLVLFLMFNALYRRALIELMPLAIQTRLGRYRCWQTRFSAKELCLAAFAVLLGAATHLLWDAFTHNGRWGLELLPVLKQTWFVVGSSQVQGYKLFQHGSSVIGLPLLAYLAWRWLQRQPRENPNVAFLSVGARSALIMLLLTLPALAAANTIGQQLEGTFSIHWLHQALFLGVTEFGLWLLILLTVYSVALRCVKLDGEMIDVARSVPG